MIRLMVVYIASLAVLVAAELRPSMGWLSPAALGLLLVGTLAAWRSAGHPIADLGLRPTRRLAQWLFGGAAIGVAIPSLALALQYAFGWTEFTLTDTPQALSLFSTTLRVVLVAAAEELIFRGVFRRSLLRTSGPSFAIAGSSAAWALTHVPNMIASGLSAGLIAMGIGTFLLLGVALSLGVRIGGDTLWVPIGVHMGYNAAFTVAGALLISEPLGPSWVIGHEAWSPESGMLGVAIWAAVALAAWWVLATGRAGNPGVGTGEGRR